MGFNFIGYPIGAALAGAIASTSIEAAILVGAFACVLGVVAAAVLIPRHVANAAARG
jgi:biotin transporter BioY